MISGKLLNRTDRDVDNGNTIEWDDNGHQYWHLTPQWTISESKYDDYSRQKYDPGWLPKCQGQDWISVETTKEAFWTFLRNQNEETVKKRMCFFFIYTYYTFIIWLAMISTTTSQGCRSGSIKRHFSRPLVPPSALWPPDNKVWNVLFNPVILRHSSVHSSMVEVLFFKGSSGALVWIFQ